MQKRSVSFTGRISGDMECFCWDDVPIAQREAIIGKKSHAFDVQELHECECEKVEAGLEEFHKCALRMAKATLTRLYPDDVMKKLKVGHKKLYRITVTENGGNVKKYTFEAFDGTFFRGMFTAYCNPQTLGFGGEVMDDWNSKGANPYDSYAVFASRNNKLILLRLRGKDMSESGVVWEDFTNEDRNSQHWRDQLRKELDSL